jgi:hypothetical protein
METTSTQPRPRRRKQQQHRPRPGVKALRPLRGRPYGPSPDAGPRPALPKINRRGRKMSRKRALTHPTPPGMTHARFRLDWTTSPGAAPDTGYGQQLDAAAFHVGVQTGHDRTEDSTRPDGIADCPAPANAAPAGLVTALCRLRVRLPPSPAVTTTPAPERLAATRPTSYGSPACGGTGGGRGATRGAFRGWQALRLRP